jgi:hypothetical protein
VADHLDCDAGLSCRMRRDYTVLPHGPVHGDEDYPPPAPGQRFVDESTRLPDPENGSAPDAGPEYWVAWVPVTKAGAPASRPWQVRQKDESTDGIFRAACKTKAAAQEITDFLLRAKKRKMSSTTGPEGYLLN